MNNRLEEIKKILPDNDNGDITEKDMRDAFSLTFEAIGDKLGVGDLPTNIGFVDEGTKQGNVHTKEQIKELLENSGKNIGNTDLIVPAGTVRELDVTGARLKLKGLENKSTDPSVNLKLKADAQGNVYVSDQADVTFNFPQNITTTHNVIKLGEMTSSVQYNDELQTILNDIKAGNLTPIDFNDCVFNKSESNISKIVNGNEVILNERDEINNKLLGEKTVEIYPNITFPADKDWVIDLNTNIISANYDGLVIGMFEKNTDNIFAGFKGGYFSLNNLGDGWYPSHIKRLFIIKIKQIIYCISLAIEQPSTSTVFQYPSPEVISEYHFKILLNRVNNSNQRLVRVSNLKYKIYP